MADHIPDRRKQVVFILALGVQRLLSTRTRVLAAVEDLPETCLEVLDESRLSVPRS